jgi:hypothetical protein
MLRSVERAEIAELFVTMLVIKFSPLFDGILLGTYRAFTGDDVWLHAHSVPVLFKETKRVM